MKFDIPYQVLNDEMPKRRGIYFLPFVPEHFDHLDIDQPEVTVLAKGDQLKFMVANQAARASAFVVSIDDEEISEDGAESSAIADLRSFIAETRRRNAHIPIFLFGETRTSQHIPNDILKELHP